MSFFTKLLTWGKKAAKISTGGWSSFYLYGALIGALVLLYLIATAWHRDQISDVKTDAFRAGQAEILERWRKANTDAAQRQERQAEDADTDFEGKKETSEVRYIETIKEIYRYVPNPATACPPDPDFVRRFNAYGQEGPTGGTASPESK